MDRHNRRNGKIQRRRRPNARKKPTKISIFVVVGSIPFPLRRSLLCSTVAYWMYYACSMVPDYRILHPHHITTFTTDVPWTWNEISTAQCEHNATAWCAHKKMKNKKNKIYTTICHPVYTPFIDCNECEANNYTKRKRSKKESKRWYKC